MNKIILMPDSFKGTMSSIKVCEIMDGAIKKIFPYCNVVSIPVADGGEGTVDAFVKACNGRTVLCDTVDPYFNEMEASVGLIDNDNCAVIEMAAASGITLRRTGHNIETTTTYGVGKLIEAALDLGVRKIIVGLGGSLTNDGGCGAAAALGIKFFDKSGSPFIPVSGTLSEICSIDSSFLDKRLSGTTLITMCDINNPLYGENGAAYIFSPQKGADSEQVKLLDNGLRHLAEIVKRDLNFCEPAFPGAGAAGGMGFGMKCFLNSKIQMGIDAVLDTVKFEQLAKDCDLIISGEGKLDSQSLAGKVVIGIARRAKKYNIPLVAVVGTMGENIDAVYDEGVTAVFSTNRRSLPFEKAKLSCEKDLCDTVTDIMKLLSINCRKAI